MISLPDARASIFATATPLAPARHPLLQARGRVLQEEIRAPHDLPAFDRSAMDGYAVARDDVSPRFRVIGEVQPGAPAELTVRPGECVRIFTGAAIPAGATQVIMQEGVTRDGEWMIPHACDGEETHIRHRGEDLRAGDLVLERGRRLRAAELSLLAHLGLTEPLVSPAPRVVHFATGRELVGPEAEPAPGEIRDSNSTLVAALLAEAGSELIHAARLPDEPEAVAQALAAVEEDAWDLLLISGGASVGDYDFGAGALRALGFTIHFPKINLRPGKPLVFASRGRQLAFVIPGNPVSHFVLFHVAIRAALAALEGAANVWPVLHLPVANGLEAQPPGRETFWPARLEPGQPTRVRPLKWQSSGDLSGVTGADVLIQLPGGGGPWAEGAEVPCLLLSML